MTGAALSDREAWFASMDDHCLVCESTKALIIHHSCYAQTIVRNGGDKNDPRAGITLCGKCHVAQHSARGPKVPLSKLREENLEFAFELLGEAAGNYFARHYVIDEPARLERFQSILRSQSRS